MKIGILALQGATEPHVQKFKQLNFPAIEIKNSTDLKSISGIILPGGESTAMINLLHKTHLWEDLKEFASKKPTWGICAGSILLAKNVVSPKQDSLKLLDITVERNAYGRQLSSFIDTLQGMNSFKEISLEGVFIRAPKITEIGNGVDVLIKHKDEIVMVEERNLWASTFHPELSVQTFLHEKFIEKCKKYG